MSFRARRQPSARFLVTILMSSGGNVARDVAIDIRVVFALAFSMTRNVLYFVLVD